MNCNACRSLSVLIVGIIPDLRSLNGNHFRRMRISDVISSNHSFLVTNYQIFRNTIYDFRNHSIHIFVLWQICKTPLPLIFLGHYYTVNHVSVCQQIDNDTHGSDSILVVVIIPCFASADFHRLRYMHVGNRSHRPINDLCFIAVNLTDFFHGIVDLESKPRIRQFRPGIRPVVTFVQFYGITFLKQSLIKLNHNGFRPDSILIIVIIPYLLNTNLRVVRCVSIQNIITAILCRIIIYPILCDGVNNFLTVFKLIKVLKTPLPAIFCCYYFAGHFFCSRK